MLFGLVAEEYRDLRLENWFGGQSVLEHTQAMDTRLDCLRAASVRQEVHQSESQPRFGSFGEYVQLATLERRAGRPTVASNLAKLYEIAFHIAIPGHRTSLGARDEMELLDILTGRYENARARSSSSSLRVARETVLMLYNLGASCASVSTSNPALDVCPWSPAHFWMTALYFLHRVGDGAIYGEWEFAGRIKCRIWFNLAVFYGGTGAGDAEGGERLQRLYDEDIRRSVWEPICPGYEPQDGDFSSWKVYCLTQAVSCDFQFAPARTVPDFSDADHQ